MALSTSSYLQALSKTAQAMGAKTVNSDFTFEVEGHEETYLLVKQAPWPLLGPQGEIEIPGPLGMLAYQPQQIKTGQQGPLSMQETRAGTVDQLLDALILNGGTFNARVYEGTPQRFLRYKILRDCFFVPDAVDRDWENRSQILLYAGTLFFNYFGEQVAGNSTDYR